MTAFSKQTASRLLILLTILMVGVLGIQLIDSISEGEQQSRWPYFFFSRTESAEVDATFRLSQLDVEKASLGLKLEALNFVTGREICVDGFRIHGTVPSAMPEDERCCYTPFSSTEFSLTDSLCKSITGPYAYDSLDELLANRTLFQDWITDTEFITTRSFDDWDEFWIVNTTPPVSEVFETYPLLNWQRYRYPLDEIEFLTSIEFYGYNESNNRQSDIQSIPTHVDWILDFPDWELGSVETSESELRFTLRRPYLYRVLTPILLISLFIFIVLIPFIDPMGSVAEVAIGMIIGLWGVRQIVLMPEIHWRTILDPIFLSLYVALAAAILIRLTFVPLVKRLNATPEEPSEAVQEKQYYEPIQDDQKEAKRTDFSFVAVVVFWLGVFVIAVLSDRFQRMRRDD